ncbi:hypothetical protein CEXT_712011 [Caerostris extrusa]|uniref:Uncharacterized protein n=1 Tax=Caerostris extrusa TaxID=172846 RepID=A0AAV4S9J2_CAEEX|nr:hypothetical protein CEXT_712011 [Caerostris extrusa]
MREPDSCGRKLVCCHRCISSPPFPNFLDELTSSRLKKREGVYIHHNSLSRSLSYLLVMHPPEGKKKKSQPTCSEAAEFTLMKFLPHKD